MNPVDKEVDRLMKLLDVGLESMRKGDYDTTEMAMKEAVKAAERLPKKKPTGETNEEANKKD